MHKTRSAEDHAGEKITMYAVIGAGPMGLAAARNLDKFGIDFVGFELHEDVGGLWDFDNPHSTMYDTAHLISSKTTTEFEEFPMSAGTADYPNHWEMRDYFRAYADYFDLRKHYRFKTIVMDVAQKGDGWEVTTRETRHKKKTTTQYFDGVIIANGTLHYPNIPEFRGEFAGTIMHSADYKTASQLDDQRLLVVGCGNSGADIAVEAVHHAKSVDISTRRGYYFIPKFIGGRPVDTIGGKMTLPRAIKQRTDAALVRAVVGKPSDFGFPDPDYPMYTVHPVMNTLILHHAGQGDLTPRGDIDRFEGNTVHFKDHTSAQYDTILLATGYKLHYPFIDTKELNWPQDQAAPQLYLNIFHPTHNNLFVLGMIEAAGLGWEGRNKQAELVALYLRNQHIGTQAAQAFDDRRARLADASIDGGYDYMKLQRMAYYVHKETYLKELRLAAGPLRHQLRRSL